MLRFTSVVEVTDLSKEDLVQMCEALYALLQVTAPRFPLVEQMPPFNPYGLPNTTPLPIPLPYIQTVTNGIEL
jgi:hypothetical protein